MSVIVSFLIVQKISLAYGRYMEARALAGKLLFSCRELVQLSIVLTEVDSGVEASTWRSTVSIIRIIILALSWACLDIVRHKL
jgi:predicted membrane chloride channel (bestrophin family)